MIENVMEKWFAVVGGNGDIRELLHDDCVFWSPVLFHPQVGAELTAMYLSAAGMVFPGDSQKEGDEGLSGSFKYTKKVFDGNHAVLEFETMMDGVSVNGVDIISCDDDGNIKDKKVMKRPQNADQKTQDQMKTSLEKLNP